jgi:polyphosphate kinase
VLKEGLQAYLADNTQAWTMDSEGGYRIKPTRRARICAQERLLDALQTPPVSAE